jgi:hypothetical protein
VKKVIAVVLAVVLMATVSGIAVASSSQPAAKATIGMSEIQVGAVDADQDWSTLITSYIKTPNQKDLVVDASLVSGLFTRTLVKSKRNYEGDPDWDTSTAHAKVDVRVLLDGETVAYPGAVTYNAREQTLSAKFMGIFTGDDLNVVLADPQIDNDGDGAVNEDPIDGVDNDLDGLIDEDGPDYVITINYDTLEPEELELILNTMSANSFNFVIPNVSSGVHSVEMQTRITINDPAIAGCEEGEYEAYATLGLASMSVDEVRFVKAEDGYDVELAE